jgi:type VI secretion system protein ImpL
MSLSRIFGLMLLFFFFEAVVAVVTTFAYPNVSVFLACVAMTGLALGVWAVFAIVTRVLARPRAGQPAAAPKVVTPVTVRPSVADDNFSQELGGLVAEANRRLAATMPSNQRGELPNVATLPLYLVVGGEGVGKTSAILNCGIEPRLLAGEAARDGSVIPTRLCNLWFAQGAVFADISGRILTQETENWERALRVFSQPVRIARWRQILFGRQSQLNLKGVVLVCDASPFVRANDPQRMAAFARTLGDRLQTAGSVLRREFPVYVVFSKCDGVQCFSDFFAHLSEPESRRLLGATLPFLKVRNDTADIYTDRESKRLTEYFNRIYMSLAEKRLVFLAREDEAGKKSTAYEFPRELKKIRGDIVQFLLDVFRPDPLQSGPRLRGFYLSGQRWVAKNLTPVAEGTMAGFTVMPKRADATVLFGSKPAQPAVAARQAGASGMIAKWMFLSDLFHNVILKDRAGNVAPRVNTRDQGYRNLAFAGTGALLLLLCMVWANSWRHNRDLLNSVQTAVQGVHQYRADASSEEALADLDSLRTPLATLLDYERHSPPISYRWGLYAGRDVTGALDALYFDRFRKLVIDPSLASLTALFLELGPNSPGAGNVYDLLKTYRMVTSGECKPDADFLGNTLLPIWTQVGSVLSPDESVLAGRQFQFYVSELLIRNPYDPPISENASAVKSAQTYLSELNGPDKILGALVDQVDHSQQAEMLGTYAPNYVGVLSGPATVEAAYTRDGWGALMDAIQSHKLASAGEACVVGKQSGSASSLSFTSENERKVKDLYVDNYIQHWKSFVSQHHVEPFRGVSDATQKLSVLSDNNRSPLLAMAYMTSHNSDLASMGHAGESTGQALAEAGKGALNNLVSKFSKATGTATTPVQSALAPSQGPSANDVVYAFKPAWVVADPANRDKWINPANQPYIQALQEVGNSLAALPSRSDPKDPANLQAFDRANKALVAAKAAYDALGAAIPNTSSGVDLDLKALFLEPITNARAVINSVPRAPEPPNPDVPVRLRVNQSARALCDSIEALRTKYPFNSSATQEATVQDIAGVFAPQIGTLAQFAQSPDVQKAYQHQGQAWLPNPAFQAEFSQQFLSSLNVMSAFQGALYPDTAGSPHFDYTVTLDGTGHFSYDLNVDGHPLSFGQKKAHTSARLVWPPTTPQPTSLDVKAGQPLHMQETGPWGLFRLLHEADKQEGSLFVFSTIRLANGNQNPLQDGHGRPVQVQIHIDSAAANAFGKGYFGKLRCENFTGWALR